MKSIPGHAVAEQLAVRTNDSLAGEVSSATYAQLPARVGASAHWRGLRRRFLATAAILILALVLSTSLAIGQETGLQDGMLVQRSDGTLYVVERGMLHFVQPVPASDEELMSLPEGDPVSMGVAIIRPPDPCAPYGVRVTVLEQERPYHGSFPPNTGLEFVRLRLRIENCRDATLLTRAYEIGLMVRDANGSTRDWPSGGNTPPIAEPLTGTRVPPHGTTIGNAIIGVPVGVPLTTVIWVLDADPFQAVEAPIP